MTTTPIQRTIRPTGGFTLIELLVVIAIAVMLGAIATPAAVQAMRLSARNSTVATVMEVTHEARQLALRADPPRADGAYACYGVLVVVRDGAPPYAAITYGTSDTPSENDILIQKQEPWSTWAEYQAANDVIDPDTGRPAPVAKRGLGSAYGLYEVARADADDENDDPAADASPIEELGWLFQPQTGAVIDAASPDADWIHIGRDPLVMVLNGSRQLGATLEIFPTGLTYSEDLESLMQRLADLAD